MYVFTWTGMNGKEVRRELKTLDEAMAFAKVLRGFLIDYKHTFEE
jgi:hypothetical protein